MPYNMHVVHRPLWQVTGVSYTASANKDFILTPDVDYRTPIIGAMVYANLTFTGGTSVLSLRWLARWSDANPSVTPDLSLITTGSNNSTATGPIAAPLSATGTMQMFVPTSANLGPQVPLTGDLGAVIRLNLDSGTGSAITGRISATFICV